MWKVLVALGLTGVFLMVPSSPAYPASEGPDGGDTIIDEYVADIIGEEEYVISGSLVCPPSPVANPSLSDLNFGTNYPRTAYVVQLTDYVTANPHGWLCGYRNDGLRYGFSMGNGIHVSREEVDRVQVWVSPLDGGLATSGIGRAQY